MAISRASANPGAVIFDPLIKPKVDRRCPVLIPISKDLKGRLEYSKRPGMPCPCPCQWPPFPNVINTYTLDFAAELEFASNVFCDDVREAQLLDGCRIRIDGELKLRDRKCRHADVANETADHKLLLGCQVGRFTIFRPLVPGDATGPMLPVFVGELTGTVGFDPGQTEGSRCCMENHTRGMMVGRGVGGMQDCEICVTYDGTLDSLDDTNPCSGDMIGWTMKLDGTVCCKCRYHEEEEEELLVP